MPFIFKVTLANDPENPVYQDKSNTLIQGLERLALQIPDEQVPQLKVGKTKLQEIYTVEIVEEKEEILLVPLNNLEVPLTLQPEVKTVEQRVAEAQGQTTEVLPVVVIEPSEQPSEEVSEQSQPKIVETEISTSVEVEPKVDISTSTRKRKPTE